MKRRSRLLCALLPFAAVAAPLAGAQAMPDRSFPVNGRPTVQVETDNAAVEVRSCGGCHSVSLHIDLNGQNPEDYRLDEGAAGNIVHLRLKRREGSGWFNWGSSHQIRVTVDTPPESDLNVETGNGKLQVNDIHGELRLHTGNGDATLDRVSGSLRLGSGNGTMKVRDGGGRLSVTTGNGDVEAEGRFVQVDGHTGNGKMRLRLAPGTALEGGVRLGSGNGDITVSVPRDLHANLDLSTGSGRVQSDLRTPGARDDDDDRHHVHGAVNGGGPTVHASTGSGDVRLSAL